MSSQYTRMKAKYDEYMRQPYRKDAVVAEMNRQLDYANRVDVDAAKEAARILRPES